MGQRPALKQKVKAMIRRKEALSLVGQGLPITVIAERLSLTVQSVRRHLRAALASDSLFPSTLTPERIAELRQLEAEKLFYIWQKLHESFETSQPKDAAVRVRLAEASVRVSERLSHLYGVDQPLKIQEEQMRLSISKSETNIKITWDADMLKAPAGPIAGLFISGKTRTELLPDRPDEHNGNEPNNTAPA